MDRVMVVVFDVESKAFEAKKALQELDREDVIAVYDLAVIARNADGSATVRESDGPNPVVTVGAAVDVDKARISEDFVEDVKEKLLPEKFALVAEIDEDTTTPVDLRMEALGATVFRRALSEVKHTIHNENVAAMKADLAQMKAEHAQAHADRKAKLQEKINQLDSKIQAQLEKSKQRRQAAEARAKAKVEFLKARAAAMKAKAPERYALHPMHD